jgi:D-lactate dehydrogenase
MELLSPDIERIASVGSAPASDRAPDWVAGGTPRPLRDELAAAVGADRVLARALDLVRYATDASPYRSVPKAVVAPRDVADVVALLCYARSSGTPLVFRAGGTSLNGQAQTDSVLVDVRRHWRGIEALDDGTRVRARPGSVLGQVNRVLAPYGRKLGPDPASTDIACVGGVIANNSGGMRCGVAADSYQTVSAMTFVLASGDVIDTTAADAGERFAAAAPELAAGLAEIRDEIRADAALRERIARKFEIKNTTGYRLCAFLDADEPVEIFRRLIVGSEGTLAFVAEAVFETVALGRHTSVSLALFPDLDAAANAVGPLVALGATATELMVAPTLIAAAWNMPGTPARWRELPPQSAALLVELRADDPGALGASETEALTILGGRELIDAPSFTRDPEEVKLHWHVREGMQGLLAAMRGPGVQLIIEDVCVRPERVAEAAKDLQAILGKHGFLPGLAGHASAGNLHFLLTPNFGEASDLERYEAFMHDLVELIVDKYDGSLKAEHGTGVNMAPYVEREWGAKATELMWRVKALADPAGILAPGVVLSRDPGVHLRNLKGTPEIEEVATKCIECGFCEPVCPSRNVTTTPRQRIALRREMARQPAGSPVLRALLKQYEYDGLETCATDGTCALACPVGIDTGKLVKGFRTAERSARGERVALRIAERWASVEAGARAGLRAGHAVGAPVMRRLAGAARAAVSHELIPTWTEAMPRAAAAQLPATARDGAAAVYLPSCVNRIFGSHPGRLGLPEALVAVSARAGAPLWIPADVAGHCCATPWISKGYRAGAEYMAAKLLHAMWRWSGEGALPIVLDASSCTLGAARELGQALSEKDAERHAQLEIIDSIAWAHDRLLPALELVRRVGAVAVHPTCSTVHLGLAPQLSALAAALAESVYVPPGTTCCGTAGDRGLLHPELPPSALEDVAAELSGRRLDAHLCSNRTCEIGLEDATGRPYESFVLLLEELTRP